MKLTKEALRRIIKEELDAVMSESVGGKDFLIQFIMDVNASQLSKDEAIDLINQLDIDDGRAEKMTQELRHSVPEEWLTTWINKGQKELEDTSPEIHSDMPKRNPSRRRRRGANAALFEGE